jgi:flagellar basal-body rod modification protein FlgD
MSQVSAATSSALVSSASSATSSSSKSMLNQEDFMKLFTKQLQYQNPMDPMDNYQMATQMAQFNTVQALNQMTQSMSNLESYQASVNSLQAVALIGKKVEAEGNKVSIQGGQVTEGAYLLAKTGKATIQVFNSAGNVVRVIDGGTKDPSKQKFSWDGKDQQGNSLPDGNYTFRVSAVDEKNQPITVKTTRVGTVSGISFEKGITYLQVGNDRITVSDVLSVLT